MNLTKSIPLFIMGCACGAAAMHWLDDDSRDISRPGMGALSIPSDIEREAVATTGAPVAAPASGGIVGREPIGADDPVAAIDSARQIPDAVERRLAIERIAAIWAGRDPRAALAMADELPAPLRLAAAAVIDREWARLDARDYLAFVAANPGYLETLIGRGYYEPEPILERSGGIRLLLASDPLSVLELADRLTSRLGTTLKLMALTAYAESDPVAAMGFVEQLPSGQRRVDARNAFATGYARADPEGALAWAQSLSPAPAAVLGNILNVVAQTDVARAVNLAVQTPWSGHPQFPPINAVVIDASANSTQAAIAADTLLATNARRRDYRLDILLGRWAAHDPESAFNWLRFNASALSDEAVAGTAYAIAADDPALAARLTDQIPSSLRAAWIERVAQGYATADAAGAIDWISRYEGQDGFGTGMRLVLVRVAGDDPVAAARALDRMSADIQLGTAGPVADLWARRDGEPAADWAVGLSAGEIRTAALTEAVGAWMAQSAQDAEDWTLNLARGADRDQALYVLLQGRMYTSEPRTSYSTNPAARLIALIDDAAMRSEVQAWFEDENVPGR